MNGISELVERIAAETSLLFMGQDINGDHFVDAFIKQKKNAHIPYDAMQGCGSYSSLFDYLGETIDYSEDKEQMRGIILEALNHADKSQKKNESADCLLNLEWNGIFTSLSFNPFSTQTLCFVKDFRECKQDYFSKKRLHLTYLFGSVSDTDISLPITYDELAVAQTRKNDLLRNLLQQIKGCGLLVIDGWDLESDWIKEQDFSIFAGMQQNSLFVFGATDKIRRNRFMKRLSDNGIAVFYDGSLCMNLQEAGLLNDSQYRELELDDDDGIPITVETIDKGKPKQNLGYISYQIYNQLERSITILDDTILENPDYIARNDFFLRFLQTGKGAPMWGGYASGFYFKRDKDDELFAEVEKQLSNSDPSKQVIILEGQSCSGKTVTLGNLAYRIKRKKQFPVLFITSEMQEQEKYSTLENLIKNHINEKLGARKTLIIWDKNVYDSKDDVYEKMLKELDECNVVIVGSMYQNGSNEHKRTKIIKLDENLSQDKEIPAFKSVLKSVSSQYHDALDDILSKATAISSELAAKSAKYGNDTKGNNNWFLFLLHGLFEQLHDSQRKSVGTESDLAQQQLIRSLEEYSVKKIQNSIFRKLEEFLDENKIENNAKLKINATTAFNMIAVAGKYGVALPALILSRLFENQTNDCAILIKFLSDNSMIYSDIDENGMLTVYFRHALEAYLFLEMNSNDQEDLIEQEITHLIKIISHTNFDNMGGRGSEPWVILSLIRKFGPNGPDGSRYKKYYLKIAEALETANSTGGNAEAVLVSCNLLRESTDSKDKDRDKILDKSISNLRRAINKFGNGDRSKQIARLKVELATNIWFCLQSQGSLTYKDKEKFNELSTLLNEARNTDFSIHSVEVFLSAALKVYGGEQDKDKKSAMLGQMLQLIDDVSDMHPEFLDDKNIQDKILSVRECNDKFDADELESEYEALLKKNSDAGIYRKAMKVLGEYSLRGAPTETDLNNVKEALKILEKHKMVVEKNPRSIYLMIRLIWISKTGQPLYTEKQFPPLSKSEWDEIYHLCDLYTKSEDSKKISAPYYLQLVYEFQFGSEHRFKQLINITRQYEYQSPNKHYTYILWCDENKELKTLDCKLLRARNNKRAEYEARLQGGKHDGTSAFFNELNFKNLISLSDGMFIKEVAVGFNLYGAVIYNKNELLTHKAVK